MKQYEIWWADLPKPAGRRPVLLLSHDDAYTVLNKFVAAEITATIRHILIEVPWLDRGNAQTLRRPLRQFTNDCETSPKRIHEVKRAVGYALAREELISTGE